MPIPVIDRENLVISFPVASETPYKRWDFQNGEWTEILSCTDGAIDLSRLNGGASVLHNHNPDEILGVVQRAWVEDSRLWVEAKFRQHDDVALGYFNDIADGILRNVSLGYQHIEIEFDRNHNGTVTRWMPFEVSVAVGIPADPSVGIYRNMIANEPKRKTRSMDTNTDPKADPAAEEQKACTGTEQETKAEEPPKEAETKAAEAPPEAAAESPGEKPAPATDAEKSAEEAPPPDKAPDPAEEMRSMAKLFDLPDLAESAIKRKLTVEDFRLELKSHIITNKGVNIMADTSKNYSICRALQALINPDIDATVEREASDLLSRNSGVTEKRGRGMMLSVRPDDPLFRKMFSRDGEFTGAVGDGSTLIGTDHRGDLFVKALRTRMGVNGATVLSGLQGNVEIPVQTGFSSIGVSALNATSGKTKPTVSSVTLSPKKFSAYTVVGEDLLYQGNPDAVAFVVDDLMGQLARKLDLAILTGIDDPEILGIDGTTGVQTVTIADLTAPTWKNILAFGGKVADYEMDEGTLAWITKGTTQANLKGVSKDTGSGRFLLEDGKMDGYPVNICGGLGAEALYLGAWRNVIIGQWGGVYVKIDDITGMKEGSVTIVAKLLADIAVTNPNAFVKRVSGASSTTETT